MGTYTSRLGLFLPAGTDAADVATIIAAWNKLDKMSGLVLCTSSTRPTTNLFPGLFIKETDTGKHYYMDTGGSYTLGVYTGGSWVEDIAVSSVLAKGTTTFATNATDSTLAGGGAGPATSAVAGVSVSLLAATTYEFDAVGVVVSAIGTAVGYFLGMDYTGGVTGPSVVVGDSYRFTGAGAGSTTFDAGTYDAHVVSDAFAQQISFSGVTSTSYSGFKFKGQFTTTGAGALRVLGNVTGSSTGTMKAGAYIKATKVT